MNIFKTLVLSCSAFLLMVAVILLTVENKTPTEIANEQQLQGSAINEPYSHETEASSNQQDIPISNLSGNKIGWGLGKSRNASNQPTDAVNAQNQYSDLGGVFLYPSESNTLYLTFDLGYENGYTETIIDILNQNNIKGTFFITGDYLEREAHIVQKIIDDGHVLANHTDKHLTLPEISIQDATDDVMNLHDMVLEQFNYEMTLFRFPKGEFSEQTLSLVQNLGYKSIFWSFAYLDWETDNQPDPQESLQKLVSSAHGGGIYLLHTVSSTNAEILDEFIKQVKLQGFVFDEIDNINYNKIIE